MALPDYSCWQKASVQFLKQTLTFDWILAGGYALEYFAGASWREHTDIDIIIKRADQQRLAECFPVDLLFVAESPGILSPFLKEAHYDIPVQDIWVLKPDRQSWMLQVMLVDEVAGEWIYKRDTAIRRPYGSISFEIEGIKVLNPEIQLLYKSKQVRPKDLLDFEHITPLLSPEAMDWLQEHSPDAIWWQ